MSVDTTEILYGHNTQEGIVSIEAWGNTVYEYIQTERGDTVCNEVRNYQPWYLTHTDPKIGECDFNGNNHFNTFHRLKAYGEMKYMYVKDLSQSEWLCIHDKASMYMIDTGKTLFKGLNIDEVHTLAFDIETTGLDPYNSVVKIISIVDNRGFNIVLYQHENCTEQQLIEQFIEIFMRLDPTIVLTYNGFGVHGFDLYFLMERAKLYGIELLLGRNHTAPVVFKIKVRMDGESKDIDMFRLFGRHCIDLRYATIKYDSTKRELVNYKLKNVISQYGFEKDGRVHLSPSELFANLESDDPKKLADTIEYCRADSEDLIPLHRHVCQADFYLSQIIPINYYRLLFTGNTKRWNVILIREYLRQCESIPMFSNADFEFTGAQVEADVTGVFKYVGDSDLTSMYPSLMLHYNIFPDSDTLGIMKIALGYLRDQRIALKKKMKTETDPMTKSTYEGFQLAYKLQINAAFGVLAASGFYWRDNEKGALVTKHGRELILVIKNRLLELGYQITALDTDGVSYTNGKPLDIVALTKDLKSKLPKGMYRDDEEGIESKLYDGIIIFKRKNYATLLNGKIFPKGSALTSWSMPTVVREFINTTIKLIFDGRYEDMKVYYENLKYQINLGQIPITQFMMVKRVKKTVDEYQSSIANSIQSGNRIKSKEPLYELAIATDTKLTIGDKVAVYWAKVFKPKPKTKTQLKKQAQFDLMDALFTVEETPVLIPERKLKWVDDYDQNKPDIYADEYISNLDTKVEDLFSRVLDKSQYEYIFGDRLENKTGFIYKDTSYVYHSGDKTGMSEWVRMDISAERDLMLSNCVDTFTTIQTFANEEYDAGESVFHPLYFDIDSPDLELAFEDTKLIYQVFANVLHVPRHLILIWFSGSKGFHIEINHKPFGYRPRKSLTLINREIALMLIKDYGIKSIDIGSIYSSRRMWRLPFSIHSKTGRRKTPIYNFSQYESITDVIKYVDSRPSLTDQVEEYDDYLIAVNDYIGLIPTLKVWFEDFTQRYYSSIRSTIVQKPSWKYTNLKGKLPKCVEFLNINSINKAGDRNNATITLLTFYKESGIMIEEAVEIVAQWTLKIPNGLTSTTDIIKIRQNVQSVAITVYKSNRYVFECGFIKSLIRSRGFECATVCALKDE